MIWIKSISALLAVTAFAAAVAQDGPQQLPSITLNAGIHNIQAEVPPQNIVAMFEALKSARPA